MLLGLKKRGFGKDKYNGFGGKVEEGETPLQAANRELNEEAGIEAPLKHAGTFLFLSEDVDWAFHIDIYRADSYTGTITETDEMKPEWFSIASENHHAPLDSPSFYSHLPFDRMWEADRYWLPLLLSGHPFSGRADFVKVGESSKPRRWWFGVLSTNP